MAKFAAFGTELQIGDGGGPEVFTEVAQVRNITGPSATADTEDVTTHDNANAWREFISLFLDGGEVTLELIFDPDGTTHQALRTDFVNRVRRNFKIVFPDATTTTWPFAGVVTAFGPSAPVDGALTAAVTIKVAGEITYA